MPGAQVISCLLLFRTVVRIAVFADGLTSSFARSQITSFVLDDALVLVAAMIHAMHPAGRALGPVWAATSPLAFASSRQQGPLSLQRRRHRRRRNARTNERIVSLPYPSPSATSRFSPGLSHMRVMTQGLPAHPSPRSATECSPTVTSPLQSPVHQRRLCELSSRPDVPFLVSQESPRLSSTLWPGSLQPLESEKGMKRRSGAGSNSELTQMVDSDALW